MGGLGNQLSNLCVCSYRFDKNYLARVEIHSVRLVHLFATFDRRTFQLFGLGIGLAHYVEYVGADRIMAPVALQLAGVYRTVARFAEHCQHFPWSHVTMLYRQGTAPHFPNLEYLQRTMFSSHFFNP
jgi:hypothetical protein